ncbi:MAG: hypothetical protein JO187_07365 [Acidobacteria bacterium]|nr:hypothetical protein [Acidobacteriaceae bacterium]MBV9609360.1 hypothetical protein [Acidobacteriota bacterium]
MFRISFKERPPGVTMLVEGRLVAEFAQEAKELLIRQNLPADLIVDLSEVTFADSAGEEALTWLSGVGAKFVADSAYSLYLCERLQLKLSPTVASKRKSNGHADVTLITDK